jgi:hypothetical protein
MIGKPVHEKGAFDAFSEIFQANHPFWGLSGDNHGLLPAADTAT